MMAEEKEKEDREVQGEEEGDNLKDEVKFSQKKSYVK